jgi:ribonucleoside-diphosphate reductase beta chain
MSNLKASSILNHNKMIYKTENGFDFPEFYDYYENTVASVWRHKEVPMEGDLRDWQFNSTPDERAIIAGILKGFVSTELGIGCYWADEVCRIFPKPEIQSMARAFSFFETIHAAAYSYLNDVLGLKEYEEFINDPVACSKIETFFQKYSDKVSLAVFSGAGEGVSLFSSFAVLLSFSKSGRYKGLAQIISWSAIDEATHSEAGCALFRRLVEETGLSDADREAIYEGFRLIVKKEYAFIDQIFKDTFISSIDPEELKANIANRANERLLTLGLEQIFKLSTEELSKAKSISSWFDPMVKGASSSDFFAQSKSGDNYIAKPTQDYMSVDTTTLDLDIFALA